MNDAIPGVGSPKEDKSEMTEMGDQTPGKDVLPDDLDITKYVGPYQFPTPRRRRTAAYGIAAVGIGSILVGFLANNTSLIIAGALALVLATVFFATAWPLNVNDRDALVTAAKEAPFAVGHASAQLSFTGWLSKPTWRVVVFSHDDPPTQRGLVEINAVNADIVSTYFDHEGSEQNA